MDFPVRCTNPTCGRNIYGPVTFCPYCGKRFVLFDEEPNRQRGEVLEPKLVETPPKFVSPQQPVKKSSVTEPLSKSFPKTQTGQVKVPDIAKSPVTEQEIPIPPDKTVKEEEKVQKETEDAGKGLPKSPTAEPKPIISPIMKEEIVPIKKTPWALIAGAVGGVVLIGVAVFIFRGPGGSSSPSSVPPSGSSETPIPSRDRGTKPELDNRIPKAKSEQPPAVVTAEVKIATNPPGAVVSVDGEKWGISPAHVKNLPPGQHVFNISKSGFRDERVSVTLSKGDMKDLQVSLASLPKEPPSPKPPPAPPRDEATDRDLAEAIRNYEQGKLYESIVLFEAVLRRDATNQRAKEYLNIAYEKRKKAEKDWVQEIETAPVTGGRKR